MKRSAFKGPYEVDLESALSDAPDEQTDEAHTRVQCIQAFDIFCKWFCITFACAWIVFTLVFGLGWFTALNRTLRKEIRWQM